MEKSTDMQQGVPELGPRRATSPRGAVSPRDKKTVVLAEQKTLKGELQKASSSPPSLLIIHGSQMGSRLLLAPGRSVMGRDPSADLQLHDSSVSRRHAAFSVAGDGVRLTDLGSANGTFVNDLRMDPNSSILLLPDMLIKMGGVLMKFSPAGSADAHFIGSIGSSARNDGLTGVMSRGYFAKTLEAHVCLDGDLSLVFLDIDWFKQINDTYGHDVGDAVLKEMVGVIKPMLDVGVLSRYGGEEFCILLPDVTLQDAASLAEQVRAAVEQHSFSHGGKVTISVGVAQLNDNGVDSGDALVRAADQAMYKAKKGGRNRVEVAAD